MSDLVPWTPAQHYRAAEQLLQTWESAPREWIDDWGAATIAKAQVHATLALARSAYADAYTNAMNQRRRSNESSTDPSRPEQ